MKLVEFKGDTVNGFQRDVIKTAKAVAYAHRATLDMGNSDPKFQEAVFIVWNSLENLNEAVEALDKHEGSKKN